MTTYEQWLEITEQIKTLTVELSEIGKLFKQVHRQNGTQIELPQQATPEQLEQFVQWTQLYIERNVLQQEAKDLYEQYIAEILEHEHPGNLWYVTKVYWHVYPQDTKRTLQDVRNGHDEVRKLFKRYDESVDYSQWDYTNVPD